MPGQGTAPGLQVSEAGWNREFGVVKLQCRQQAVQTVALE